jgi:hypothetical protein
VRAWNSPYVWYVFPTERYERMAFLKGLNAFFSEMETKPQPLHPSMHTAFYFIINVQTCTKVYTSRVTKTFHKN